jgi:tryptophan synthase beta chain
MIAIHPSIEGYYGEFGGAFIPEILHSVVTELRENYLRILQSNSFQREYLELLKSYVGRPTPLFLASRLSAELHYQVFLKREDLAHTGSHKINNALGQALLARALGKRRIIAETGAGQHGVATATACALLGLKCIVYMGEKDINRQALNVSRMKFLGAEVRPVSSGSKTLKDATNEALRDWIANPSDTHYIIGSVVGPHPYPDLVARLQSVISREIVEQVKSLAEGSQPNTIIACVGGGSNAIGAFFEYLNQPEVRLIGVEAAGLGVDSGATAATLCVGTPGVLHGSRTVLMQSEDGQVVEPYSISAGLDYPGVGPQHAYLSKLGRVEYVNVTDDEALSAARQLAHLEGIIPALESAHALAALTKIKLTPDSSVIVCLSGRGDKDMDSYGRLT